MRDTLLSNNEKSFVLQAIKQNRRLDGRRNNEFRSLKIDFGTELGCVLVTLGQSRVLAHITGEIAEPKATQPNEGIIHINVEMGPMAAPHFEAGRNCELTVRLNRTLERTFKDSRCVDLESLCIISEEKVWVLRVDLNVLNYEGNLFDCCSVATLCALAHYRRPDITISDNEIHVHPANEKETLPMVMHHYPVCVSYAVFDEGRIAVADPTVLEERTSDSHMIFGINSFQELCCLNLGGAVLNSSMVLLQTVREAAVQAKKVVDLVKNALAKDLASREAGEPAGFNPCVPQNAIAGVLTDRLILKLRNFNLQYETMVNTMEMKETEKKSKKNSGKKRGKGEENKSQKSSGKDKNLWLDTKDDDGEEQTDKVIDLDSENEADEKIKDEKNLVVEMESHPTTSDSAKANDSVVILSDESDDNRMEQDKEHDSDSNDSSSSQVTLIQSLNETGPISVKSSSSSSSEEDEVQILNTT